MKIIIISFLLSVGTIVSNGQAKLVYSGQSDSLENFQKTLDSMLDITKVKSDSILLVRKIGNENTIGKKYPKFSKLFNKVIVSNESLRGKVVFINFWFYSCTPCMREMDELNSLYERYGKLKNFEFLSFTFENQEQVNKTIDKLKMKYKIFSLVKEECGRLNFDNGYPTSIILDKNGVVKYIHSGGEVDKEKVHEFFEKEIYPVLNELL